MKNLFLGLSLAAMALLAACSSGSGTNSEPLEISSNSSSESFNEYDGEVESFDDLPKCSEKKDGKVYYVEDEDIAYTCSYDGDEETGEWVRKKKKSSDDDDKESSSSARKPDVSSSSLESNGDYDGEVESFDDLPKCSEKKDGKVYYVEDEDIAYTCRYDEDEEAGEWINASGGSDGSSSSDETDEGKSSASEEPESSGSEGVEGSSASVSGEMVSCDIPGVMGECMEYPVGSDEAAQLTEFCVSMLGGTLGTGCAASTRDSSVYDAMANTLTDLRDNQVYRTITIEVPAENYSEVWMAENLNFVTDNSWCYIDESDNCAKYGRLYKWAAAVGRAEDECGYEHTCGLGSGDIRGACPKGWHLPSKAEWEALIVAVDGSITEYTSNTAGSKLKSQTGWTAYSGTTNEDAFGFSALPAGYRLNNGLYSDEGNYAHFWSSAEIDSYLAYYVGLYYGYDSAYQSNDDKVNGFSVRCLKD